MFVLCNYSVINQYNMKFHSRTMRKLCLAEEFYVPPKCMSFMAKKNGLCTSKRSYLTLYRNSTKTAQLFICKSVTELLYKTY